MSSSILYHSLNFIYSLNLSKLRRAASAGACGVACWSGRRPAASLMVNLNADLPKNRFCPQPISQRWGLLLKSAVLPQGDVGHGVGSGMLASILLVGRSPWSTRSPCRHDRLLDGRVECHPTNGIVYWFRCVALGTMWYGSASNPTECFGPRGVRRRGIRSQTAWLSTIIWAITPPRVEQFHRSTSSTQGEVLVGERGPKCIHQRWRAEWC
jgi:hypothetical protein